MHCYGFFVGEELWKHENKCELRESGESYEPRKTMCISGAFLESACLAGDEEEWSKNVREFVLSCMTQHEIYNVVKKDMLILRFGSLLLKKVRERKTTWHFPENETVRKIAFEAYANWH